MNKFIVWTLGGSDSSSGAGIQNDLATFRALGVHGCSVITANTAQNAEKIHEAGFVAAENVQAQINSLKQHFPPKAIKISMLGNLNNIIEHDKIVLDPLILSSSGYPLFIGELNGYITLLKNLLPQIYLLTPNKQELELLLNKKINTPQEIELAAQDILSLGVKNVLIKGGHFNHESFCQDYWSNGTESFWLTSNRLPYPRIRGTGCALASAITGCLALGYDIKDAIVIGKMYVNQAIRESYAIDNTHYLTHLGWPENQDDLPQLSLHYPETLTELKLFTPEAEMGIYPIVDSVEWLEKLLPQGITTIQLRVKNKTHTEIESMIQQSVDVVKKYSARLYINDYWELAIKYQAYGVHLGQEDLHSADIKKIHAAGLRLGISTHCYHEVARAHTFQPSYMACGPIYFTSTKVMPFQPQGIVNLQRWRRTLRYPLVAIGGINFERLPEVVATGVNGVAMISAITNRATHERII